MVNVEYHVRSIAGAITLGIPLWLAASAYHGYVSLSYSEPAMIAFGWILTLFSVSAARKVSGHSEGCPDCGHTRVHCDCDAYPEQYG